jgi:hypothetical protein
MGPVVRSLILKGFRSLSDVRIEFDNPTFLVGRNGAGKSNIGDALGFVSEAMTSPLREVIDRRGGITDVRTQPLSGSVPAKLGLGVVFGLTEWMQYVETPPELPSALLERQIAPGLSSCLTVTTTLHAS